MDWLPALLAVVFLLLAAGLGWKWLLQRQRLRAYTSRLQQGAGNALPPADLPGLVDLSNTVRDLVAARQQNLLAVEAERARLASVLERMTDGVLIADAAGRVQFSNPAARNLFSARDVNGRSVAEVLRHYQLVQAWQRSRAGGEIQEESVELPARRQFLQVVILPDQQTGGSLLLAQDLTRVRRLETVRRDFISNLSHELRTPLASLKALTETLRDGALDDPVAAPRFLERIETEVDALIQMAQELLDLSRIESGQVPLDLRAVPPQGLLESAARRMSTQAERARLALVAEASSSLPAVRADAARLEQVLVNLVHNAVKFTEPGGTITLNARQEQNLVRFAVSDTGVGIPEDDLERIFERFYKADRARTGGGTGLGLSISRHIVEAHGGRIWVESTEGQGSTFFFTIPVF